MGGFNPEKDLDVNLSGKVILVTGATAGLGFATAQILVRKGATVYLGARSEERAKASIKRIEDEGTGPGNGKALYLHLDLADPQGTKKSAEEFLQKEQRLDVLINNAALTIVDHNIDRNGVLDVMTVNYFSQVVLTEALLPLLKKTAQEPDTDVRIVNLGSDAYKFAAKDVRFKSKEDFSFNFGNGFMGAMKRYGTTKLAFMLWSAELQRHLNTEGSSIIVICAHPGAAMTENSNKSTKRLPWPFSSLLALLFRLTFATAVDGAANSCVSAVGRQIRSGPNAERYKGAYTAPVGKIVTPTAQGRSEELATELWETTHTLLKDWGL